MLRELGVAIGPSHVQGRIALVILFIKVASPTRKCRTS